MSKLYESPWILTGRKKSTHQCYLRLCCDFVCIHFMTHDHQHSSHDPRSPTFISWPTITNIHLMTHDHQHSSHDPWSPTFISWPTITNIHLMTHDHQHSFHDPRSPTFISWPTITNIHFMTHDHQHSFHDPRSPTFISWPMIINKLSQWEVASHGCQIQKVPVYVCVLHYKPQNLDGWITTYWWCVV